MSEILTILVISDLHAHNGDPKASASSYFSTNSLFSSERENPLAGVASLIKAYGAVPNWLICPGDLGDKADPNCQRQAWDVLERIRAEIGAEHLIGAAGNHDLDSRRTYPEYDPKGALQTLVPSFPISIDCYQANDIVYSDRYWSNNFVVVPFEDLDCNLLVINSCAFHGYSSEADKPPNEHLHGRLSPLTLAAIQRELTRVRRRLNVALVHHHPRRHPWIDDGNSVMAGGEKLIECLKDTEQQWLVIHGHQHVPHLAYADAGPFAPIVLSAASVSAKTYPVKGNFARNQIHLLEIPLTGQDSSGSQLLGTVTSWSWSFDLGWHKEAQVGGIPFKTGFGYRPDLLKVRDEIFQQISHSRHKVISWDDVIANHQKLVYLVPDDHSGLIKMLGRKNIKITYDDDRMPDKLELMV